MITPHEKDILRELAKIYLEYASLPIMDERTRLWHAHNKLAAERPMIAVEIETFENDLITQYACESPEAVDIERVLMRQIVNFELIGDDKVIPKYFPVASDIKVREFGIGIKMRKAKDSLGREIGYEVTHPIKDLQRDLPNLKRSEFFYNRNAEKEHIEFINDIFGDILPVKIKNDTLCWYVMPTYKAVMLMGLENLMFSMVDFPEETHRLFDFINEDTMAFVRWQEEEGLLLPNSGNDYVGGGSYGFTDELPTEEYKKTGILRPKDLWVHINSQESVGISSAMYGEYIFPRYCKLAQEFGLLYYGCCEAVNPVYRDYISKMHGLRKISISRWTDEEAMGRLLRNGKVIYSRKPDPAFLSYGKLDEESFMASIVKTIKAADGCGLEFIYRDVYKLDGDPTKPRRAVDLIRKTIDRYWNK